MIRSLKQRWKHAPLGLRGRVVVIVGFVASASVTVAAIEVTHHLTSTAVMWRWIAGFGLLGGLSLTGVLSFIDRQATRIDRLSRMAARLEEGGAVGPVIPASRDEIGQLQDVLVRASSVIAEARSELTEMHRFREHIITSGPVVVFLEQIPELTLTYLSPNAGRVLGVDPADVVGRQAVLRDLVRPDHRSRVVDAVTQMAASRRSHWKGVVASAMLDGPQRWLEMELRMEDDAPDGTSTLLGYVLDVTDRVELEETAIEATFRYQSLFERIPTGIFRTTFDGAIVEVNPAFARMLGYRDSDELLTAPITTRDVYADPDLRRVFVSAMLADGSVTGFEAELQCRGGETLWVSLDASIIYEDGEPTTIEGSAINITARRRAEHEARSARIEATRANRAKSDFLSRMSHELRTPLNSILGFSQLLEMRSLDQRDHDSIRQIHRAGKHLLTLINEVLDIARVESGRLDLSVEPVETEPLIADAIDLMRPMADSRQLSIEVVAAPGIWVMADQQRLKQVLLNVLSNAVKYNQRKGRIGVTVESTNGSVTIEVSDTGPGITDAQMSRLFVPFDRLGAEHGPEEGTGLGMVLSQNLINAMDGQLMVTSKPGVGTTVAIHLNVAERPAGVGPREVTPAVTSSVSEPDPATRTVVYIEDNTANLNLVIEVLALRPDIALIPAINGRLGIDLVRQHNPDVVLLDLNLPGISGRDVLRELRADPSTRDIAVIVLSADATPSQIRRLREAGADAYLTKPLDISLFFETLDRTLAILT